MSADLKILLISGLAGIHLPRGSVWGGRVATDRQSYGFQVFEDVAVGMALPNPDAVLLPDGSFCSLTSAKDWRAKLLSDLLPTIYGDQEVEVNQTPAPTRYIPDFPPDFITWNKNHGYPDDVLPDESCLVFLRNGELRIGEAGDFNWGQDEWDTTNEIVAYKLMKVQPVGKKKPKIPADFTLWNGVGRPDLHSDDSVSVIYYDGVEDSGLVADFIWSERQAVAGLPSRIMAYRVDSTAFHMKPVPVPQFTEIEELHPEPEAAFIPSPAVDGVRTFRGTTADPEAHGFLPVEDVWALETDLTSGPGAFMYRDGHIVAVANAVEFHRSHMKGVSTFRAPNDNEVIIGYKVFDEDAVFWEGDDVDGPDIDPLKTVTAYFAVSPKVTRDSFTLDWSAVGDPWNDVVAYKVWK